MKKIFSVLLLLIAALSPRVQEYSGLWHRAPASYAGERGLPAVQPERFAAFTVAEYALKDYLATAPQNPAQARIIDLPAPDGSYRSFRVWKTPAMEKGLAIKYPGINTYTAEAVGSRRITAKLDYTSFGFHAMIFDGARTYLVDPYSGSADGAYIAYYKSDYNRPVAQRMACSVGEDDKSLHSGKLSLTQDGLPAMQRLNGSVRRTYRLALAADSEYCAAVAGINPTKVLVLSKMVTTMNRVNGVYEREFALTMQLVANEDTLIFLGADSYTNNSGGAMLNQNQAVVTARIGTANYDIGHVFSTGGGGIASQGSICQAMYKARGVTGSASPAGDAFDIDYVAHEMGHQYGAGHTFNANTGSCAGNGVPTIAYEPASGSTIMAYAGICTGNDYQAHSDAYFHSASLEEISTYISAPNGGGQCPMTVTSTNTNAGVPIYAATYTIPYRTPFELTAPAATDPTADTLTYCWEQRDLGDFTRSLALTRLAGPIFRSFPPDTSRTRVFPRLSRLLAGTTSYNAEKLPDTGRALHFRVTERDIYQGWGTFNFPDDVITLDVVESGAPFTVTSPAVSEYWVGGDMQTVTWDVVGTNAAPVSCANVDIYLSVDGGYTYPYLVKAATPNDGSEIIKVPNVATTSIARLKVKGAGNVFFNISNGDFTIEHGTVGINPSPLTENIIISPVPAKDVLHISIPAALGVMQLRVINPIGQTVWSGIVSSNATLPVGNWARGVYHVQLYNAGNVQLTRKIVIE